MDTFDYIYEGKLWRPSGTITDNNSFFHSTFGARTDVEGVYLDRSTKYKRMRWAAFLTYFENETMPPSLADRIRKCLSANNKYKDVLLEDKDHFENYVSDIMKAKHDVTMEEIPILASLENVKIILFSDRNQDPIVINPDAKIVGSYPHMEKFKGEVVLCLEKNIFSRLNLVDEDSTSKSVQGENKIVELQHAKETVNQFGSGLIKYRKGESAGSKGVQFQVGLLTVFLLNALQKLKNWKLSTENKEAGKFDDVVLEWSEAATLLQAKHKQSKTKRISLEDLVSTNSKNDDFSLPKYFLSYVEVKNKFKLKNLIICTNAGIDGRNMKFLKHQRIDSESLLHYEGCGSTIYTFNEEIVPYLKKNIKIYYEQNYQNKGVDETIITDENIKDFLQHLQFYSGYPPGNDIKKVIEQLLTYMKRLGVLHGQISSLELYSKVMDWFQQKDGVCLTGIYAKAMFSEIWRDKRWEKLKEYNVAFRQHLNFQNSKRIFYIIAGGKQLLQEIKIVRSLWADKTKVLHIAADDDTEVIKQVTEAFELPRYSILVFIWTNGIEEYVKNEVNSKLREVLNSYDYKKVILVAESINKLPQLTEYSYDIINQCAIFNDLSKDTQRRLFTKKDIAFQGKDISLEELLITQSTESNGQLLKSEVLEKIVRNELVQVGKAASQLGKHIAPFYITRKFRRLIRKDEGGEKVMILDEIVSEEIIYEATQKMVLITDGAGTGKTTVLVNLAATIKEKNPHLWVIRIDLNDYTKFLKNTLETHRRQVTVLELLNSKNETKLRNDLEEYVFSIREKIVLLLDGFDEISPDYTNLVLGLLEQCQKEQNFAKVIVTTRPHMTEKLEDTLQARRFVLEPLTKQNQVDFLTRYWMHSLNINGVKKDRCKLYAKGLMSKITIALEGGGESHFSAVPLHVRMLAEIFQERNKFQESADWEGCKQYLSSYEAEPKLPETINIKTLYEMFIEKKRSIFIEKGNPCGNTAANQALIRQFEECLCYQRSLALEVIFNKEHCGLFSCYQQNCRDMETNILKMGIVQKLDKQFYFVHRTFAEFFVAESLSKELQFQNQNADFQHFFIGKILLYPEFRVTRIFLDSFLQEVVDELPSTTFRRYQSREIKFFLESEATYLLRNLTEEGQVAILRLILKCIDFSIVRTVPSNYKKLNRTLFVKANLLNTLQSFVRQVGVNVEDDWHQTPLQCAIDGGHLQMVKFLVEQGANVNIGRVTPLHQAVKTGNFEISKFLVEQGADMKAKDEFGKTALYLAVKNNHRVIVTYFLLKISDLDKKYSFYVAAYLGRLDILGVLLEKGLDVNNKIEEGEPLIFGAIRGGQLETIEYLVQQGADIKCTNNNDDTGLCIITQYTSLISTANLLVKLGLEVNSKNFNSSTALHIAVDRNNFELVKFLVISGANVHLYDGNGTTALHIAASNACLDCVKFLLQHGADVNHIDGNGNTALHMTILGSIHTKLFEDAAYCKKKLDVIKFIIENGGDVNITDDSGRNALHLIAKRKVINHFFVNVLGGEKYYLDIVKVLIATNSSIINFKDNRGRTALHLAASSGYLDLVKFLVQLNAEASDKDNDGRTALHAAVRKGHLNTVKFLTSECKGIETVTDNDGRTALHLAAGQIKSETGNLGIITFLVQFGVDINVTDNDGCTALHLAVHRNGLVIVEFLVHSRADVTIKNNKGSTALHLAASCNLDIVRALVSAGADIDVRDSKGKTPAMVAMDEGLRNVFNYL